MTKTVNGIYPRKTPVFCLSCTRLHILQNAIHEQAFLDGMWRLEEKDGVVGVTFPANAYPALAQTSIF
jgi:hypothetical protein